MKFRSKKIIFFSVFCLMWLLLCGFNTPKNGTKTNGGSDSTGTEKQNAEKQDEKSAILKEWEDRVLADVNNYVNVREEASTEATIVGRLFDGDGGTILEKEGDWTKIRSGNVEGYVSNDYLLFGEDAYEAAQEKLTLTATVDINGLRIRDEAGTDSKILKVVEEGTKFEVVDEQADESAEWIHIQYAEEKTGYVSAEYVTLQYELGEGMTMEEIKEKEAEEKKEKLKQQLAAIQAEGDEVKLLAALIQAEGGGQPYDGKVGIGAVVMNRVKSPGYPNTISEVIYAPGQFGPASNGTLIKYYNAGPSSSCMQAAQDAINGYTTVGTYVHFKRAGADVGENSIVIGSHVFY